MVALLAANQAITPMKRKKFLTLAGLALLAAPLAASAQSSLELDANLSAGTGTALAAEAGASTSVSAAAPVAITAAEAANGSPTLSSSAQVASEADFAAYARGAIKSNASIKEVDSNADSVTVRFSEPARILGIFPVTLRSAATIAADGSVRVEHPWYYFLATSDADETGLKTALAEEATVFSRAPSPAAAGATSTAGAEATLSASEKARLLSGMTMALGSALSSSASAR